jgi:hypothetical protein
VCCHALDDCLQRYPATLDRRPLRIVRAIRGRRIDADVLVRGLPSALQVRWLPGVAGAQRHVSLQYGDSGSRASLRWKIFVPVRCTKEMPAGTVVATVLVSADADMDKGAALQGRPRRAN